MTPNEEYNCNWSKFDIKQHKEHYVNYFEAVILEDGTVEYAHPSHQEKLANLACNKLNISRPELVAMCPPDYYFDFITWLCQQANAIAVWVDRYEGIANKRQITKLKQLKIEGIYLGSLKSQSDKGKEDIFNEQIQT